jgi:hypothetical protein
MKTDLGNRVAGRTSRRRGMTALELLAGAGVGVLVLGSLTGLARLSRFVWINTFARYGTQSSSQNALGRIESLVREARKVDTTTSTAARLTIQMPKYQNKSLMLPLQDGDLYSFYLSDSSGRTDRPGTILWRMVNGTPDRSWSMVGGHARVETASGGLKFTYLPNSNDPAAVTVEITTASGAGRFTTSETYLLRNKGL